MNVESLTATAAMTDTIFDCASGALVGTWHGHAREVLDLQYSPDGTRLFSADLSGVIRLWDTQRYEEVAQLIGHESHIRRLVVSADGRTLVSGSRDGTARVWSVPSP